MIPRELTPGQAFAVAVLLIVVVYGGTALGFWLWGR